jgi:hypothetical protein
VTDTQHPVSDTECPTTGGEDPAPDTSKERVRWEWLTAAISLVIAWSAIRGIAQGYTPIADNALLELRSRDVLTSNHPLLGTGSSASVSAGIDVNHPGPLLFDLMAIPIRLFGSGAGVALSIAAFHIVTIWLVGFVIARSAGNRVAIITQVVTAGLVWSMGSELLYDPWQPNVLVLPFWLFLCCIWSVSSGHVVWLPLAVGYGSFAMQTHLSYVFIVPALLAFAVGRVAWQRRSETEQRFDLLRRPLGYSALVIVVLWAQPLWEQAFGSGRGNLTRLFIAGTGGEGEPGPSVTTGLSLGARLLASVIALPPWWGRYGYDDAIPPSRFGEDPDGNLTVVVDGLPSLLMSAIGLLIVAALIGGTWWLAWRRGAATLTAGFQTLGLLLFLAVGTVVITPIDVLGLSPHKLRWLWVVAAFASLLIVLSILEVLGEARRRAWITGLFAIGIVALIATLPTHANQSGPVAFRSTNAAIDQLRDDVADYLASDDAPEKFVFDADGIGFGEPYTSPIIAELAEQSVDFVVPDPSFPRQVGEGRRADGDPTRAVMFVRVGEESTSQPGAVRVAFHDGEMTNFSLSAITDRAVAVFVREPDETSDQ